MKILITGANGQLATEFKGLLGMYAHTVVPLDRDRLDITRENDVEKAIAAHAPEIVINCAAYNFVDRAETDYETAVRVNALGVKYLAVACEKIRALLVHYSTDYVFDGAKDDFYTEEDETKPINNYGISKLLGEQYLREATDRFLLFRVSWVFGDGRQNFLMNVLEWAHQKRVLKIACDQISVPTSTRDIALLTMFAWNRGLRGLYHLTNGGYASRYEVARYFLEKMNLDNIVLPVPSDSFPSAAKRPYFSAMSNRKLSLALDVEIPDWRIAIDGFVESQFKRGET